MFHLRDLVFDGVFDSFDTGYFNRFVIFCFFHYQFLA